MVSLVIYAMGVVGLLAIGWIPLRFVSTLRRLRTVDARRVPTIDACRALSLLACLSLVVLDAFVVVRLAICLTSKSCGGGIAAGWYNVVALGAAYLFLEVLLGALGFFGQKLQQAR